MGESRSASSPVESITRRTYRRINNLNWRARARGPPQKTSFGHIFLCRFEFRMSAG